MRRSIFVFVIVLLLLPGSAGRAWATDPVSPEENLVALYGAGKVEEARIGFRKLTDDRLAEAREIMAKPPGSELGAVETAWQVAAISQTLVIWEASEVRLQFQGGTTPPRVYAEVEGRIEQVDALMERLGVEPGKRAWKNESAASVERVRRVLNESITKTVAFLRKSSTAEKRQDLLARAAKWHGAPVALREFDEKNADLLKVFKISIEPAAKITDGSHQTRLADREKDVGVFNCLEDFYRALFKGNVEALETLVAPEVIANPEFKQEVQAYAGWTLNSIDRVFIRNGEDGSSKVSVEEVSATAKDGQSMHLRGDFVLRRTPEGSCQVMVR
jgi:hypothetical protein